MKNKFFTKIFVTGIILIVAFTGCQTKEPALTKAQQNLKKYNVIWDTPSKDHHGTMPLGNGDISLNAWVDKSGDICFYIGKTDSWGDNGRLLKVGRVNVKCEPAILNANSKFSQELDLLTGRVKISASGEYKGKEAKLNFNLWVDANNPVIYLTHNCSVPISMTANIDLWRTHGDTLSEIGVSDLLEKRDMPGSLYKPVVVEPDHLLTGSDNYIGWYHHNIKSVGFDLTNKLQGLSKFYKNDPILHRTFGAIITGLDAKKTGNNTLETKTSKNGRLNIFVLTEHPCQPADWQKSISALAKTIELTPFNKRESDHKRWWSEFWNRSWIYATPVDSAKQQSNKNEAFVVTQAYTLQRYIDASNGRGNYPIKFNGSIFTVPAKGKPGDADYRLWGPGYWWQNTRLPYLSMCAAGDFDLMQPFFKMYAEEIYPLCKKRTKKYFGFEGAYFPECMYFWGSTFTATYGWTPYEDREDPLQESPWHKWEWVSGLELVYMMMDYYDYTGDKEFLQGKIIPLANDVLRFFDNYYKTNNKGELVMHPSMACETWWDCTNPMPELAGLHSITKRMLALPENITAEKDRKYWESIQSKLPEIPLRDTPSGKALAPAKRFENKRNFENPELYAVFPFRLFGLGNPKIEWAKNALKYRWDKGHFGWRQDDIFMAYLGLGEQAKAGLVQRAYNYDKRERFPAFWGPNYDWTPDQDHGGTLMKTFQSMLIQADPYSKKIYITPAWPNDWNAEFKLHAPYKTIIEGRVTKGKVKLVKVTPSTRRGDIVVL